MTALVRCEACSAAFDPRERSQAFTEVLCRSCGGDRWRKAHPLVIDRLAELGRRRPLVYLCRDAAGDVVYVGSTYRLEDRIEQHAASRPWWPDVVRVEWTGMPNMLEARRAELARIHELRPRFNVQGVVGTPWSDSGPTPDHAESHHARL